MIKLDENGMVVYTDPLADEAEVVEEETPPASDAERIEALEAEVEELRLANGLAESQITDLQLALCDVYEATL